MNENNGWLGKPGVPINPEKDGWHWLEDTVDGVGTGHIEAMYYAAFSVPTWYGAGNKSPITKLQHWRYLGPCLTPDEAAALQKRVAELEDVLRAKVTEIERAYSHEGHCIECHGVVRAWGNTEHRDDCWYVKARATLERRER